MASLGGVTLHIRTRVLSWWNRYQQNSSPKTLWLRVWGCVCAVYDDLLPVSVANPNQWDVRVHHGTRMRLAQQGETAADQLELVESGINDVKVNL